ncbi:Prohormone-4 [Fasciola gigantica]|uniref:Prohormone-4 n=1 Tax=Fasciola gigantica TaxID=46835 RepID=A0A504YM66_FASGI|nr:Prohormone-4 [Fasciola gigantica]
MRKLNTTIFLLLLIIATMEAFGAVDQTSNQCPKSKPWPCRTPNVCLSFALICDGEIDCPDEYDEDPDMCTAKDRPAEEHLQGFINKYRRWLIPNILGEGTPVELATKLVGKTK